MTAQPTYAPSPPAARSLPGRPTSGHPTPGARARIPAPRRRTGRTLAVVFAVLVVLAGLAAVALHVVAPKTVQPASVQDQIVRLTQSAVQVTPADVRCPAGIEAQAGATFTCTGTVDGQPVTWWVHQDDAQGHMTVTSDRLLRLDALEQAVATKVGSDLRTRVTADCGPAGRTVLRNTPGQEIDCTAVRTTGATGPLRMTVTVDENGVTAYRIA